MCGITGIFAFNMIGRISMIQLANATQSLAHRGPDFQNTVHDKSVGLGHRRLSIIDTSPDGHQPMTDPTGRYSLVFNGEIFNFAHLRESLRDVQFRGHSDTEVLLHLLIREGASCLDKLNGFFAFALYDRQQKSLLIARDRLGIKPLYYFADNDRFLFGSEMRSILAFGIEKKINLEALHTYLQLNYIPAPQTILKDVKKLLPGEMIYLDEQNFERRKWYTLPHDSEGNSSLSYEEQKTKLAELLEESVKMRLVSDVPLGSFLSGGTDSSIIATLAARHKEDLHTFSIGYRDEPFFDETKYAELVAKNIGSHHHVFSLTNSDLYQHVHSILDGIDEPFADSSAIAVNILSRETRKYATVALSGDGADELFGGYNKHAAFQRMIEGGTSLNVVNTLGPLWKILPKSRNNKLTNLFRQLDRFSSGMKLSAKERYWRWAGFADDQEALKLFSSTARENYQAETYHSAKATLLDAISNGRQTLNDLLYTDCNLVLPDDMLTKVDRMSMAHGLEIRVPFLDHRVAEFAQHLPSSSKIDQQIRKRILQDTYRDILPPELYNRPKKGFEVPLLSWLRKDMRRIIEDDLLNEDFLKEQNLFNPAVIADLHKKLHSSNPGDAHARIWGLLVFQWWYKRFF